MEDLETIYKKILENDRKIFIPVKKKVNNILANCALRNPEIRNCCHSCKYSMEPCENNDEEIIEMVRKDLRKQRLEKLLSE